MNICVAGWYYRPSFLQALNKSGYDAMVMMHREGDTQGLPGRIYPNRGLEFGCYQAYLKNHWDGESDVLFCHDDAELASLDLLDKVASLGDMQDVDQAYIFRDEYEEHINNGCHGRGIWARGSWLKELLLWGGFPADMKNEGDIHGKHANAGIFAFRDMLKAMQNPKVGIACIVPGFRFARRGWLASDMYVFRRIDDKVVTLTEVV